MGTGYVRNDTANNIAPNQDANAADIDGEFDAIVAAFHASTGHTHDGTTAEGAPITFIGPTQDVTATATELAPSVDGELSLGASDKQWNGAYIDGDIEVTGTVDGRDIATDGAALDSAEAAITALDNRVSQNESDIDDIEDAASILESRVDDAESDIDDLETLTATHTTDITTNTADIASNDADIAALQATQTAMVQTVISALWPVGSTYMSSNNTMPSAMTTGRTWVAYAAGRALVGVGTADGVSYSGGTTRGANDVTLSTSHLPSHSHGNGSLSVSGTTGSGGVDFSFSAPREDDGTLMISNGAGLDITGVSGEASSMSRSGAQSRREYDYDASHEHSFSANVGGSTASAGSGNAHSNIQPSIGVYVWRRTA